MPSSLPDPAPAPAPASASASALGQDPKTVFVTSATGLVGSTLCELLIAQGYSVRATTRDLSTPAAQALLRVGVHLVQGSWDAPDSVLRENLGRSSKLFLCLLMDLFDASLMPQRAAQMARVARAAGVTQVVTLTSLGSAMVEDGAPLLPVPLSPFAAAAFPAGYDVEKAAMAGGFDSWTLLRPGFFMANFLEPKIGLGFVGQLRDREKGVWRSSMAGEALLGLVDHVDIAKTAVAAFEAPAKFHGKKVGLVSDEMPVQNALDGLARAIGDGRKLKAEFMGDDEMKAAQEAGSWLYFCSDPTARYMHDYVGDLAEIGSWIPGGLTSWDAFLAREEKLVRETYGRRMKRRSFWLFGWK